MGQANQVTQEQEAPSAPRDSWQASAHSRRQPQGQAHTIRPPRQAVQVERIGHVALGGGHHLNQPRIINRPGQSSHNPDANADTNTEPETELEPESEPEIEHQDEIIKPIVAPSKLRQLFNPPLSSPSPLPSAHQPIDPHARSTLDLPFGYDQPSQTSQTRPAVRRLPPHNNAGPSRPRGNARQEASRAQRASKPAPHVPEATDPKPKLPPAMNQALNIARARYRLRLRVERERRTRANTHSRGTTPVPPDFELPRRPALPELMEDDEEERIAAAAEASNQDPKPKSKSKSKSKPKPVARDVHGNERHVLTISKAHLFAYSVVEGAWQTRGLITNWANAIFQLTWEQEFPGLAFQAPSPRTIQCMVNAQPAFRGRSKEALRPFTEFYWGFKKPASTPADIAHNIALTKKLLPNNFHCLSYDPPYGHYESEALRLAIAIVLFNNPTAVGVVFSGYVNPCPETAAAYTLANMQFSIEEYSSGRFQPRELNASEMLNKYVAHLRGLKAARRKAKGRFKRLAQEWFNFGMEYSGAAELEDPFTQAVTLASDVRPDTPTLDETSEHDYLPEPELEEHESELTEGGRYSKRAKGKGRA